MRYLFLFFFIFFINTLQAGKVWDHFVKKIVKGKAISLEDVVSDRIENLKECKDPGNPACVKMQTEIIELQDSFASRKSFSLDKKLSTMPYFKNIIQKTPEAASLSPEQQEELLSNMLLDSNQDPYLKLKVLTYNYLTLRQINPQLSLPEYISQEILESFTDTEDESDPAKEQEMLDNMHLTALKGGLKVNLDKPIKPSTK